MTSCIVCRGATAGKAPKAWALPRFWISICSYKKQLVKKIWGRILGLAWLKFALAPLVCTAKLKIYFSRVMNFLGCIFISQKFKNSYNIMVPKYPYFARNLNFLPKFLKLHNLKSQFCELLRPQALPFQKIE
jgi:hypothetical protein